MYVVYKLKIFQERALSLIHLKIDSIGFDGEATLSEQKGGQINSRTPFVHRGPSVQGYSFLCNLTDPQILLPIQISVK